MAGDLNRSGSGDPYNWASRVEQHLRAQKEFWYFATEVLGYRRDPATGYFALTKYHREVCDILNDETILNAMFLMPRYSIKSHLITVGYALWRIARNPNIRILIYSETATKAEGFLYGIKTHIEGNAPNSRFRKMYPNLATQPHEGGCWTNSKIIVSTRTQGQKEPTVDTGGIETGKVGNHYDEIIFDDIVSDLNVTTKAQMDKVADCYKKSLALLKPGGRILMVGTRWHYGDVYGRIIEKNKERKNFTVYQKSADERDETGRPIFWTIGLNKEFLHGQRRELGSYLYSCIYLNSPVDDETAMFRPENFMYYKPHTTLHEHMYITCAIDPAGEGQDMTAITVCGTDNLKNLYVLDAVNKHLKPSRICEEVIRLNYKWGFHKCVCEKNFYHGTLEKLYKEMEKEHKGNSMYKDFGFSEGIHASIANRNFNRCLALQAVQEQKRLFLPGENFTDLSEVMSELAHQMISFTVSGSKSQRDDLIISLSFHVDIMKLGGRAQEAPPPTNSAAWLERKWVEDNQLAGRRLPVKYRRMPDRWIFS